MSGSEIAIVGMAARFPGARNAAEFWENLKNGVESIRVFSDAELLAAGVSAEELAQPEYVKLGVVLEDFDMFDAGFFGFSPRDAAIMDPQHRIFLECAWAALEDAGHVPGAREEGSVAVYAGSGLSSYMIHNLLTNPQLMASAGLFLIRQTGNDKDVLATRVSYELNLHGPSISVQTACSTSLVAVHLACQSLLNQECDMALAGGVTVEFPHGRGYLYREGEILSRDGHCRAFDAESSGTVFSSGAGIVVLKRLEDAIAARDNIRAVILGSAINNDGSRKVGYLAPSVDGQSEVILEALGVSGVEAKDISYIETHGTGTKVGDPIEVKALTQAFRSSSDRKGFCAIGSLKSNIGHTDTAAGVGGLIKTTLALQHRQIPPSLHFTKANPLIDFESSPFYVNTKLRDWSVNGGPRRAGVTSLGIGGTNAHVVLEEAPPVPRRGDAAERAQVLVLSARTPAALAQAGKNLSTYLQEHPEVALDDVAYTLQVGRKHFAHRRAVVSANREEAANLLVAESGIDGQASANTPGVVFMFSGQGSQYVNMGRELYQSEPKFRDVMDECADGLSQYLECDLRKLLYPVESDAATAESDLENTRYTQPALFSIEYALAQWWMEHGVRPSSMVGHSIGEYVAACLAGVFTLQDGLRLSAMRGRLMSEMPTGAMLSVAATAETLSLPQQLSMAAINGPEQCVLSGEADAINAFARELEPRSIPCRLLHASHAFHSAMMEPMLEKFQAELRQIKLQAPKLPYISNVTGTWITPAQATDVEYWARHLRGTVRWADGLTELFREPGRLYLEVGPGQVLTALTRLRTDRPASSKVVASMRQPRDTMSDIATLLKAAGQAWVAGTALDWNALHEGQEPRRVPLPTYPFERQRYWIEPGKQTTHAKTVIGTEAPRQEQWFHQRVWKEASIERQEPAQNESWLLFMDDTGLGAEIAKQLKALGQQVISVVAGNKFGRRWSDSYLIRPGERKDYDALVDDIIKHEHMPTQIVHLWSVSDEGGCQCVDRALDRSFYSLMFFAQAWGDRDLGPVNISCVSNGLESVMGERVMQPARATMMGPVRVISKEFEGTLCRSIDFEWLIHDRKQTAAAIVSECVHRGAENCVAYRKSKRWVESFEPTTLKPRAAGVRLKEKGVYVITGGTGGIGLELGEHLARTVHARLVLIGRTALPPRPEWQQTLERSDSAGVTKQKIEKLRRIESLGAEVLTLAADITSEQQTADAVREAQKRFGKIDGVIHAAGVIDDALIQTKSREAATRVLAPKINGTLTLEKALQNSNPDFVMLFSSVSSFTAPEGQVDYAAANAFLDAFALSDTAQPFTSVNWGMWAEIGLAVDKHELPQLSTRLVQGSSEIVYAGKLSTNDWLVREHRYKESDSLLPGTGYMQLAAAALMKDRFDAVVLEDVYFVAPLLVPREGAKDIRVRLVHQGAGYQFSVLSKENVWIEHATGHIARNHRGAPAHQGIDEIRKRCTQKQIAFNAQHRTKQEHYFDFGPRWRNLRSISIGEGEALAHLELDREFLPDIRKWWLHPALLDLATGSALYLIPEYETSEALYLPLSYGKLTVHHPLPGVFFSHIRSHAENNTEREAVVFDITLLDSSGRVLAEIENFSMRHMAKSARENTEPQPVANYADEREGAEIDGMSTADAIKAFDAVLASEMRTGIIVRRGGISQPATTAPTTTMAPAMTSTTSAAKSSGGIEGVLSDWWQELLGVEKVGPDDDFFDLGGHSLVGVRLVAKIRKTYQVDLNLAVLFEARTIRHLAALIRKSAGPEPPLQQNARKWLSLVPIQPNGSKMPIFCVHAVGTSVMFYQALAKHLGQDQPFYALQSPLVSNPALRETTIEELASMYVNELEEFLPEGPFALGGWSFGGMIALEMARKLSARGRQPSSLVMFDVVLPIGVQRIGATKQLQQHWQNLLKEGPAYLVQKSFSKAEYWWWLAQRRAKNLACRIYEVAGRGLPATLRSFKVEEAHFRALKHYTVGAYSGRVTLMRAVDLKQGIATIKDAALGWDKVAPEGLEIHDVPGWHLTIFEEPNVQVLAEKVQLVLADVNSNIA